MKQSSTCKNNEQPKIWVKAKEKARDKEMKRKNRQNITNVTRRTENDRKQNAKSTDKQVGFAKLDKTGPTFHVCNKVWTRHSSRPVLAKRPLSHVTNPSLQAS